jgi:hypothetical protein
LKRLLTSSTGYSEVESEIEATRSFVIGSPARWIFIGDTTGSTEDSDPTAFTNPSLALSRVSPIIDVLMRDSSVVHLLLYNDGVLKDGVLIDKYGNGTFP